MEKLLEGNGSFQVILISFQKNFKMKLYKTKNIKLDKKLNKYTN